MIDIRLASTKDAETISALNDSVQKLHADALPHVFKPPSADSFPASLAAALINDPDTYIYLALVDEKPAGYIYVQIVRRGDSATQHARDQVYIHHIAVEEAFQRRGVGRALMRAVIDLAEEKGIKEVSLDTWAFNSRARRFFKGQGFEEFNIRMWRRDEG